MTDKPVEPMTLARSQMLLYAAHLARIAKWAAVACLFVSSVVFAAPPAPGSESYEAFQGHEAWVRGQHTPRGSWCCDLADGRVAEIRKRDGWLEVYYARATFSDGTDQWIRVPPEAVLPQMSPIYAPIAWIINGHVFCLALAGAS